MPAVLLFAASSEKQIPFGNYRKKSKGKSEKQILRGAQDDKFRYASMIKFRSCLSDKVWGCL